jgi:hypothetical protein
MELACLDILWQMEVTTQNGNNDQNLLTRHICFKTCRMSPFLSCWDQQSQSKLWQLHFSRRIAKIRNMVQVELYRFIAWEETVLAGIGVRTENVQEPCRFLQLSIVGLVVLLDLFRGVFSKSNSSREGGRSYSICSLTIRGHSCRVQGSSCSTRQSTR